MVHIKIKHSDTFETALVRRVLRSLCRVVQQTVAVPWSAERIDRGPRVVARWPYRTQSISSFPRQHSIYGLDHGGRSGDGRAPRISITTGVFIFAPEDHRGLRG